MAARTNFASAVIGARVPIVLAMAWAVLGIVSADVLPETDIAEAIFFAIRAMLLAAAGWFAIRGSDRGLWTAALIGALVMLADHVIVKGGAFIAAGEYMAFWGVLISYAMFVWAAMALAAVGAAIGRSIERGKAAI